MPSQQSVLLRCHLGLEELLGTAVVVVLQMGNVFLAARAGLCVLVPGWFSGEAEMLSPGACSECLVRLMPLVFETMVVEDLGVCAWMPENTWSDEERPELFLFLQLLKPLGAWHV